MDINLLQSQLNQLWASTLERLAVDLCAHSISMDIIVKAKNDKHYQVIFEGVSSLYFVSGEGDARFDEPPWDYAEISEFYYQAEGINQIAYQHLTKKMMPQYRSSANFVLELWSSALFIEAKSVVINGERFEVGYPRITNGL
ncbi:hypothetical protein TFLX_00750 [Thermoflexales bacterium]|nr:hypothetical protein TFLX_00750 [Thermoflexales bacterium]